MASTIDPRENPRLCLGGSRGLAFARIVPGVLGSDGLRSELGAGAEAQRNSLWADSARLKPCPFYKTRCRKRSTKVGTRNATSGARVERGTPHATARMGPGNATSGARVGRSEHSDPFDGAPAIQLRLGRRILAPKGRGGWAVYFQIEPVEANFAVLNRSCRRKD